MTRTCDCCGARDCTVSPGGDVGGVARPAACWRCRCEPRPECYECGTEIDGETCLSCDGRRCVDCDAVLPEDQIADSCMGCIALQDGEPLPWDDGYPAREVGR